jgi:hypothetical protein
MKNNLKKKSVSELNNTKENGVKKISIRVQWQAKNKFKPGSRRKKRLKTNL